MSKTLRLNREDGLTLGRWFTEDPTLRVVEIPIAKEDVKPFNDQCKKHYHETNRLRDNYYVNRFFNNTVPVYLLPGIVIWLAASKSFYFGLAAVFVWAVIDIIVGSVSYREHIKK